MCCLAIVSILMGVVLPYSQVWLATARVKRVSQDIEYAVRYARNTAYLQDKPTVLSPMQPDNWSYGMQLQLIDNQEDTHSKNILYTWKWGLPLVQVTWLGFQGQKKIVFSNTLAHEGCSGHFIVKSGRLTRKLVLNRLGRIGSHL